MGRGWLLAQQWLHYRGFWHCNNLLTDENYYYYYYFDYSLREVALNNTSQKMRKSSSQE